MPRPTQRSTPQFLPVMLGAFIMCAAVVTLSCAACKPKGEDAPANSPPPPRPSEAAQAPPSAPPLPPAPPPPNDEAQAPPSRAKIPAPAIAADQVAIGEPEVWYTFDAPVTAVAFAPDGRTVAVIAGGELTFFDSADGLRRSRLPARERPYTSLAWTSHGDRLVVADGDDVFVWDPAKPTPVRSWPVQGSGAGAVAASSDGRLLTAGANGVVRFWTLAGGEATASLPPAGHEISALSLGPGGFVCAHDGSGGASIWRPWQPGWQKLAAARDARAVLLDPAGWFLARGLEFFDPFTLALLDTLPLDDFEWHSGATVTALALSTHPRLVAVAADFPFRSHDYVIVCVSEPSAYLGLACHSDEIVPFLAKRKRIGALALSPNAHLLVWGDGGGTVYGQDIVFPEGS